MTARLLALFGFCLSLITTSFNTRAAPQGYFVSVDGLNADHLPKIVSQLDESFGLKFVYENSTRVNHAFPLGPSITAPSHISIATCAPPSVHGIYANRFFVNKKRVSGFSHPISAETAWQAFKKQNRRIFGLYPGLDGQNEQRSVNFGFAYPQGKFLGEAKFLSLRAKKMQPAKDWQLPSGMVRTDLKEAAASVVVNKTTKERLALAILVNFATKEIFIDFDKNLRNGFAAKFNLTKNSFQLGDIYFQEGKNKTATSESRRRIVVGTRLVGKAEVDLRLSPSSYNEAYPKSYRKFLREKNLIWPTVDGVADLAQSLGPMQYVKTSSLLDNHISHVVSSTIDSKDWKQDLTVFYQPLIDKIGHRFESYLPAKPNFQSGSKYEKAYVEAYKIIDRNLARVFRNYKQGDAIAVMGDHGMQAVTRDINLAFLTPKILANFDIIWHGPVIFLYSKGSASEGHRLGKEIKTKLSSFSGEGSPILHSAIHKSEVKKGNWDFGDADWVFYAKTGFSFTYDFSKFKALIKAHSGRHGYLNDTPTMATPMMFVLPNMEKAEISKGSLADAVPTFAKALGLKPPRHCRGKPLF